MKKGLIFLAIVFQFLFIMGFSVEYGPDNLTAGVHEKITQNAFQYTCVQKEAQFVNKNLVNYIDWSDPENKDIIDPDCNNINDDSIFALLKGVRYNDLPEIDGNSAMGLETWAEVVNIFSGCDFWWLLPPLSPTWLICKKADAILGASNQVNMSNEAQYPLMHAQLNNDNFRNNPHHMIEVMRNYVKAYFYELLVLSLTASDDEPENRFVSYSSVFQHGGDYNDMSDLFKKEGYW